MGNPRLAGYACACAVFAGLASCNPIVRESDLDDYATRDEMDARLSELEWRVEDLESQLATARQADLDNAASTAGLRNLLNRNADAANENSVRAMTARGACGQRLVQVAEGIIRNENIPCTVDDLRPAQ